MVHSNKLGRPIANHICLFLKKIFIISDAKIVYLKSFCTSWINQIYEDMTFVSKTVKPVTIEHSSRQQTVILYDKVVFHRSYKCIYMRFRELGNVCMYVYVITLFTFHTLYTMLWNDYDNPAHSRLWEMDSLVRSIIHKSIIRVLLLPGINLFSLVIGCPYQRFIFTLINLKLF